MVKHKVFQVYGVTYMVSFRRGGGGGGGGKNGP